MKYYFTELPEYVFWMPTHWTNICWVIVLCFRQYSSDLKNRSNIIMIIVLFVAETVAEYIIGSAKTAATLDETTRIIFFPR